MAKKSSVAKQRKREKLANNPETIKKRQELKAIIVDVLRPMEERLATVDKLNKMKKNTSRIRLRNRCQFTGRSRGVTRKFKMSRLCIRELGLCRLHPWSRKSFLVIRLVNAELYILRFAHSIFIL